MRCCNRGLCKLLVIYNLADSLLSRLGHAAGRSTRSDAIPKKRVHFVRLAVTLATTIAGYVVPADNLSLAQTLEEALATAYENNPTLSAQRARLRATDEQVPQALSGYRPTLRAFSEVGRTYQDSNAQSLIGNEDNALFARTYGATLEQPLFRGGQTVGSSRRYCSTRRRLTPTCTAIKPCSSSRSATSSVWQDSSRQHEIVSKWVR
jgi:hypothetical protein